LNGGKVSLEGKKPSGCRKGEETKTLKCTGKRQDLWKKSVCYRRGKRKMRKRGRNWTQKMET